MEPIETIEYKGFNIEIYPDEDPGYVPSESGDCSLFLVHYHRDFHVTMDSVVTEDEIAEWYRGNKKIAQEKSYHIFPVTALIHSGVHLQLGDRLEYDPYMGFDTSHVGAVLVEKKYWSTRKKAQEAAASLIREWNCYLSGQVYGYIIQDFDDLGGSCWGYVGDYEEEGGPIDAAKSEIDAFIKDKKAEHFQYLKNAIRGGVSLNYRKPFAVK